MKQPLKRKNYDGTIISPETAGGWLKNEVTI